jgi:hypothetical protein
MARTYDVPVVCTVSGLVYVLESVVDPAQADVLIVQLCEQGTKVRFLGRSCAEHRTANCTYRPLAGPLFVPRP